ncbi:8215_t:CDS:10 [Ambispora leptoticha]|uniref:8215_t:CDS:1 n=1 Tax=Ambispora leptoticha TaxID=144679 RepID=A0A9N9A8P9_9GLOM|nr:8215_t:CDS:10 [Ambispora leptoticha]
MNLSKPSSSSSSADAPGLLYASFNQDFGCFATGLDGGFRIFNCDPFKEKMRRDFMDGGISIIEMLFRCNYLALVGGGKNPKYPPNKVIIWDDSKNKDIVNLEFKTEIKNVKLRRDRIVVVLSNKVHVFQFSPRPQKLHTFETIDNEKGLVALSSSKNGAILAFPGRQKGHIQIVDLPMNIDLQPDPLLVSPSSSYTNRRNSFPLPTDYNEHPSRSDRKQRKSSASKVNPDPDSARSPNMVPVSVRIIAAHTGKLSCIAVNEDGSKCASASEKGTLIRVFDTTTGKLLNELRRGVDRAEIYSISFSPDSRRLCVSSDKGTVHIFNLDPTFGYGNDHTSHNNGGAYYGEITNRQISTSPPNSGNRQSSLSFMKDLLPKYFSSEWSFAHVKLNNKDCRCICGFGQENNVFVIYADGSFYNFHFDPRKGALARTLPNPPYGLRLPEKFVVLEKIFNALQISLNTNLGQNRLCIYHRMKNQVEEISGRNFDLARFAQIIHVFPQAFTVEAHRYLNEDSFLINFPGAQKIMLTQQLNERKRKFHDLLFEIVKKKHEEYLKSKSIDRPTETIDEWHADFDLESIEDIPEAKLPQLHKSHLSLSSPKIRLSINNIQSNIDVAKPVETQKSSEASSPESRRESLRERIRAKEMMNKQRQNVKILTPEEKKRRSQLSRLSDIAQTLSFIFASKSKEKMRLEEISEFLSRADSDRLVMSKVEAREHLRLLAEILPAWFEIFAVEGVSYLRIENKIQTSTLREIIERKDIFENSKKLLICIF